MDLSGKSVEVFYVICYVLSVILNLPLLLMIITRSSKEMGSYKYLLFVFVFNDIIYAHVHQLTHPAEGIYEDVFFMVSTRISSKIMIDAFAMIHSHSFILLALHFIYRYAAILGPTSLEKLTSAPSMFILFIVFVAESAFWFCNLHYMYDPQPETIESVRNYFTTNLPEITMDAYAMADYWRPDGSFNFKPILGTLGFTSLMVIVFIIVAYCAFGTVAKLRGNILSSKLMRLQKQLFYTLLAQFAIPVTIMYVPVAILLWLPFLKLNITTSLYFFPSLFALFPIFDAIVIVTGIRDYREAVRALFRNPMSSWWKREHSSTIGHSSVNKRPRVAPLPNTV